MEPGYKHLSGRSSGSSNAFLTLIFCLNDACFPLQSR